MSFLEPNLNTILSKLTKLEEGTLPQWGGMSAQRMVEHLTDSLSLATGKITLPLEIPEDKTERAKGFVLSEHPLPVNFQAGYAPKEVNLRNKDLKAAISEFKNSWKHYLSFFEEKPNLETLHPNFGKLDFLHWQKLNSKHLTHHFKQFGLI